MQINSSIQNGAWLKHMSVCKEVPLNSVTWPEKTIGTMIGKVPYATHEFKSWFLEQRLILEY